MTQRSKILRSYTIPVFLGVVVLLSLVSTCERFPELVLEVTTDSIVFLPAREYKLSGSIVRFGSEPVTQHGFCWAEESNPTTNGQLTELGGKNSKGSFSSMISNLSSSTYYYVRAYVITSAGTEYGEEKTFTTPAPTLPIITSTEISNITQDSAQSGGTIIDDGGTDITAKGICWDTTANPNIANSQSTNATGSSPFTSKLSGLDCSTTYYVRAYATNKVGTAYGNEISFTTVGCTPSTPYVLTTKVSNIMQNSAECGGNVTDEGFSSVVAKGVCWSESPNPTPAGNHTTDGSGLGAYTSSITGLTPNTVYYVRAYATNSEGTSYGEEESFSTLSSSGETVTDFDGNVYKAVQIGDQVWMAENLKVTHYADGEAVPIANSKLLWDALGITSKAYCWYNDNEPNGDIYGALYSWAAAMNGAASSNSSPSGVQGVCPNGWHLPSDNEWKDLEINLGMNQIDADGDSYRGTDEGGKLKEQGTTHWNSPNKGATNSSGFTALPGGARWANLSFGNLGNSAIFWTATEREYTIACDRRLDYDYAMVERNSNRKEEGFSVRCVKDQGYSLPTVSTSFGDNITNASAQSGGNITSDGGAPVTARGVCWSTSEDPTLSDQFTTDGSGTGPFTSSLTGLECNTTYYVRAYASNSVGTAYGSQVDFTTSQCSGAGLPTVTTSSLSNITTNSAQGGGEIVDDGGKTILARGVCWSTSANPTISDFTTNDGTSFGTFTSNLSGLVSSTTYFVKAYASNSAGTTYGDEMILKTYEGTVSDVDGNDYWTVIIGEQKWMAENLKTTKFSDGTPIPNILNESDWDNLGYDDHAYSWYDNNTYYKDIYGGLYTWSTAMKGANSSTNNPSGIQGVCPDGWHLPSDSEWKQLEMNLGMNLVDRDLDGWRGTEEGAKMKEAGTLHWNSPNSGSTNESGFSAFGGSSRNSDGSFINLGVLAYFWTATENDASYAWHRSLHYNRLDINRESYVKDFGYSIRCIEGQGYFVPTVTTTNVTNTSETSANAGGNVTNDGGQAVLEKGLCWSTDPMPTIDDIKTVDGSGLGSFTSSLTGLKPYTTYYIRAYATNDVGTGYGVQDTLKTLWDNSTIITDYDGNEYSTIRIGEQVWMQESLNSTHYADGTAITLIEDEATWIAMDDQNKAYCWYDNNPLNGEIYGALYTWAAAMNGENGSILIPSGIQGVCPNGWHLPSDAEWIQMEIYLGMSLEEAENDGNRGTTEGGKLKESGMGHWASPNTGGTNESGFTALPASHRPGDVGWFQGLGSRAYFWTATDNYDVAKFRRLWYNESTIYRLQASKNWGFSVRCMKD